MSDFKLCIKRRQAAPFYYTRFRRAIFTIEELSYLICENAHLIDDSIINKNLREFLMTTIGEDISEYSFIDTMIAILRSNNLYCIEEINVIINILKNYRRSDAITRAKMIGDKSLINKDYCIAIENYNAIINRSENDIIDNTILENAIFNKGVACALQLNFKSAYSMFDMLDYENDRTILIYRLVSLRYYNKSKFDIEIKFIEEAIKSEVNSIVDNTLDNEGTYTNQEDRCIFIMDEVIEGWKHEISENYRD